MPMSLCQIFSEIITLFNKRGVKVSSFSFFCFIFALKCECASDCGMHASCRESAATANGVQPLKKRIE